MHKLFRSMEVEGFISSSLTYRSSHNPIACQYACVPAPAHPLERHLYQKTWPIGKIIIGGNYLWQKINTSKKQGAYL